MTDRPVTSDLRTKCRSVRHLKDTWHVYVAKDEIAEGNKRAFRDYVERCVKCGNERTVEFE